MINILVFLQQVQNKKQKFIIQNIDKYINQIRNCFNQFILLDIIQYCDLGLKVQKRKKNKQINKLFIIYLSIYLSIYQAYRTIKFQDLDFSIN
ncbi:transmembrane protein, putative (macronuclear) [Tetrahymena thermophila SB210]|uniref:Transmembrane protein, putative n=1 Tax=Tetrahymena thermophila (strain SB210) TaxID=312017 RepID=W7X045_TETTS|nr:transmembrane protein, putative [Tetrahymena thermophila SB210]EWS72480.1 transmembrane protein, putative [Tetrahymena thermophila SB210]|eukprot:XP_012654977.1 transmembrane protein, putative [Tetrahymena thermophila SB210]